MNVQEALDQNASRIAEAQEELARVERILGTAKLSSTATAKHVLQLETEATEIRASLESLVSVRFRLRKDVLKESLVAKADRRIARERLTELVEDIRHYSAKVRFTATFKEDVNRTLRESVLKRADIARDLGLEAKRRIIDADLRWIIDDMLEARLLDSGSREPKIIARATADILRDIGLLRPDLDTGEASKVLWRIIEGILVSAAGSGLLLMGSSVVSIKSKTVRRFRGSYKDAQLASRKSVDEAITLFVEPVDAESLFGLLVHLSGVHGW